MSDVIAGFRERFLASLPDIPAELDLRLDEFIQFDPAALPSSLPMDDAQLLVAQGLPRDAPPFLSFCAYSPTDAADLRQGFGIPESCFPIGHNGSGDVLAIDLETREVVYFNHDNHNARVFINSSLCQFAESLCIYQEHHHRRAIRAALSAIAAIDPAALHQGSMWQAETSSPE